MFITDKVLVITADLEDGYYYVFTSFDFPGFKSV